jgi:hypothetical protein
MPTPFSPTLLAVCVTLAVSLFGCGSTPASTAPSPTPTARTAPTTEEMTSAFRFRTTFGLRADDAWIRAVFNDPASDRSFGVPLLPSEVAAVMNAQAAANAVSDIVAAYGATAPEDWAGMYVDQQAGGTVVARFKANVDKHRTALLALLPAGAKVDVRSATWSDAELRGFIAQVEQETDWFPTIGTKLFTVEIAGLDNLGGIDVRFDGPKAKAGAIEAHFGNPPWLRAVWNGPGEWTGARGDLEVYTSDAAGRPVSMVDIVVDSEDDRVTVNSDIGFTTDELGHLLHKNYPAVAYRVRAFRGSGDERVQVAEGRVIVPPNARATIRLIVN